MHPIIIAILSVTLKKNLNLNIVQNHKIEVKVVSYSILRTILILCGIKHTKYKHNKKGSRTASSQRGGIMSSLNGSKNETNKSYINFYNLNADVIVRFNLKFLEGGQC